MDSTGVGEGLYALLDKTFPLRVIPVKFNTQVKSELGWKFLSIVDTGRFHDTRTATFAEHPIGTGSSALYLPREGRLPHVGQTPTFDQVLTQYPSHVGQSPSHDQVLAQYVSCRSEVRPGPNKTLRWGVPDGTRAPDGQLVHDDILLADALVAELDFLKWYVPTTVVISEGFDPLTRIEGFIPLDYFDHEKMRCSDW